MGTSKSLPTPGGGAWTPLKSDITDYLEGDKKITPGQIVGGTVRALGSLSVPSPGRSRGPSGTASSGGSGGRGHTSVAKAVSGLAGFGSAFQTGGLSGALQSLGLDELRGRSAVEVVARIADHLADGTDPTQYELLSDALKAALIEAAALQTDEAYLDLEAALQAYFDTNGVEGLVQLFLSQYVYDRVWMAIENHVEMKAQSATNAHAMSIAVSNACRSHVESLIQEIKAAGRFDAIDWFGKSGIGLANDLVTELENRLRRT
jgi:hypothetical protein